MEEKTNSNGNVAATTDNAQVVNEDMMTMRQQPVTVTAPPGRPENEQRKAYGTAKTENLRDSGSWRVILPVFVALCCLALLAVPLLILIPLLSNSLQTNAPTASLVWLWITMIVLEVIVAAAIIYGLVRIFMTQAGNYSS